MRKVASSLSKRVLVAKGRVSLKIRLEMRTGRLKRYLRTLVISEGRISALVCDKSGSSGGACFDFPEAGTNALAEGNSERVCGGEGSSC